MESTGTYHYPILHVLVDADIFVAVENPLVIKKYISANIRKGKTDKMDAIKLAQYGLEKWLILKRYESQFAETFWHFDLITKRSEKSFIAAYNAWVKKEGYRPSESRAKEIYALAKDGTPTLSSSMPSTKTLILESIRLLNTANLTLRTILSQMHLLASELPEYSVVNAMKGVGSQLSVLLIAEIGDVRRFHNGSALVAYAGLDAPPFQSGTFDGTKRHISKRGSSQLRKLCFEVMMALKLKPPKEDTAVYDYMLKKEAEGKPKMVAKVAAMNKFLRIYYARVLESYSA